MSKQNALIAGTVVIASVLALAPSANAQYYGRPMYGGGYGRPMYGGPAYGYGRMPPTVLPYQYPSPRPYNPYNSYAGQPPQPANQGRPAQWNTTDSHGLPEFPTLGQDVDAINKVWPVIEGFCGLFC